MSTSAYTPAALVKTVSQLAANLKDGRNIQESLVKLAELDVSLYLYKQYGVQKLAVGFIMHSDAKEAARKLVGQIRTMEKSTAAATGKEVKTGIESMMSSKRTAPTVMAPKQKKAIAQLDAPLSKAHPVITSTSTSKNSDNLTKYQQLKRRLAEKYQATNAHQTRSMMIEVQENVMPEPPTKRRCQRRC